MKQKLLYIITKSNLGGAQRYVLELASALSRDDFDVAVACGGTGLLVTKLKERGITVFPIPSFDRDINLKKELQSIPEIWQIFKTFKPDIVHLNSSKAGGIGALLARLYGVKNIIFTAHGWPFFERRSFLWRTVVWLLSWVTALLAHKVILVSEHDRNHARMPFVEKKLEVIYPAIPDIHCEERNTARTKLFQESIQATHAHDVWLVTIAELTPNKNILSAIQAVAQYNRQNPISKIFYTIIGDGELREAYETYVRTHNLQEHIMFLGYIDTAGNFLKAFDLFILPSHKEGFPYVLLEAQNAGLYVLASNVGGIPEMIEDGTTGSLFNPADINSMIRALDTTCRARAEKDTVVQRTQSKTSPEPTFTTMVQSTVKLYHNEATP